MKSSSYPASSDRHPPPGRATRPVPRHLWAPPRAKSGRRSGASSQHQPVQELRPDGKSATRRNRAGPNGVFRRCFYPRRQDCRFRRKSAGSSGLSARPYPNLPPLPPAARRYAADSATPAGSGWLRSLRADRPMHSLSRYPGHRLRRAGR